MANERLKDFPAKTSPTVADILYLGDASDTFNEVKSTIAQIISAYPNLSAIGGLSLTANTYIYSNAGSVITAGSITALGISLLADGTVSAAQGTLGYTATPTASLFAGWDASKNLSANSHINGYTTTATAAATTTLTVASTYLQFFTGSTTQTVTMPVTSTLVLGQQYKIVNNSSGTVTVQSSGANSIQVMAANTTLLLTCILTSGTSAASWNAEYIVETALTLPLSLANGGTNAALTAVQGGIVYSGASALAISAAGTSGQLFQSAGTSAPGWTTATYPSTATTTGSFIYANGTNFVNSTSLWPNTVGAAGKMVRSDGTVNAYTTSTFADTYAINTLLYASSANTIAGLPTANSGVLITDSGGIPSIGSTLPSAVQANITALGTQGQALNMGSHLINNVTDPSGAQDAATKNYVDTVAAGRQYKDPCAAASTTALTVTYNNGTSGVGATLTNATTQAAFAVDGYSASVNDRILIKDQASTLQNGIYVVTTVGSGASNWVLTRATDMDQPTEFKGGTTFLTGGTTQAGQTWTETATVAAVGTDAVTFSLTGDSTAVTSVATGTGLTGGTITSTGTISMANMAANSLKGNNTGGSAAPADLTVAQVKTMINTAPAVTNYTSGTGTYTVPAGALYLKVIVKGSGGNGGAGGSTHNAGGGGGEGGYVEKIVTSLAASYSYAVGAVGANTTFDTLTAGFGANGAAAAVSPAGGLGGSASGGDINLRGACGTAGSQDDATATASTGGDGGGWGGGPGVTSTGSVNGTAAAANSGGGGSGATGSTGTGGAGAVGYIYVVAYFQ